MRAPAGVQGGCDGRRWEERKKVNSSERIPADRKKQAFDRGISAQEQVRET